MNRLCSSILALSVFLLAPLAVNAGGPSERDANANLYLISPQHGATITSPVTVRFGLNGMGIAPAGIEAANTGHHHLLVDVEALPDLSQPLPNNEHFLHFGKGQTETQLELKPGRHTLRLLLGDYLHRPHSEPLMSEEIVVFVKE